MGNWIRTVVPSPALLVTAIWPPCAWTSDCAIASPSPVPPRPGSRVVGAVEAVEEARQVLGRDSFPGVADRRHRLAAPAARRDGDPPARRRVFDGVVEQDQQHLMQSVRIRLDHERLVVCPRTPARPAFPGQRGRPGARRPPAARAGRRRRPPARAVARSERASESRSPVSRSSRAISARTSSKARHSPASGSARCWSSSSVAERRTVSGVRSSCEASATNSCWRRKACWIGTSARPARNQAPARARSSPSPPPARRSTSSRSSAPPGGQCSARRPASPGACAGPAPGRTYSRMGRSSPRRAVR